MSQGQYGCYEHLMKYLVRLPDPRGRKGRRYHWDYLLGVVASAFAAGCRGPLAMAEWAALHQPALEVTWGPEALRTPSESTLQRLLRRVKVKVLEKLVAQHNLNLLRGFLAEPLVGLSMDGKWVRTASAHGERVLLLSLCTHREGIVIAQRRVPAGRGEETAAPDLLADLELRRCLVTLDAGLTSPALAALIAARGGQWLMAVKKDQPTLYEALVDLFASPLVEREVDCTGWVKSHGRLEWRQVAASGELADWLEGWPGRPVALQRTHRWQKPGEELKEEVTYALTSWDATAAEYQCAWRGHWSIENKSHYVRDDSLGEDRRPVWCGDAPQVLAALANALIALIRTDERWEFVPPAIRWAAADPSHAMQLVGIPLTMH